MLSKPKQRSDNSDLYPLVYLLIMVGLCSCHTYEAVVTAPVEFWDTAGTILEALWADLMEIVDLIL